MGAKKHVPKYSKFKLHFVLVRLYTLAQSFLLVTRNDTDFFAAFRFKAKSTILAQFLVKIYYHQHRCKKVFFAGVEIFSFGWQGSRNSSVSSKIWKFSVGKAIETLVLVPKSGHFRPEALKFRVEWSKFNKYQPYY